jgi:hypothetical protein
MYGLRGSISRISCIDQRHAPTTSSEHDRGTKTGGPSADNHDIDGISHDLPVAEPKNELHFWLAVLCEVGFLGSPT